MSSDVDFNIMYVNCLQFRATKLLISKMADHSGSKCLDIIVTLLS